MGTGAKPNKDGNRIGNRKLRKEITIRNKNGTRRGRRRVICLLVTLAE